MKDFERDIIGDLLLSCYSVAIGVSDLSDEETIEYSGSGYYLSIIDESLPSSRIVLDTPDIRGQLDGIDVGYVGFIENGKFVLECYSYDQEILPINREHEFVQTKT